MRKNTFTSTDTDYGNNYKELCQSLRRCIIERNELMQELGQRPFKINKSIFSLSKYSYRREVEEKKYMGFLDSGIRFIIFLRCHNVLLSVVPVSYIHRDLGICKIVFRGIVNSDLREKKVCKKLKYGDLVEFRSNEIIRYKIRK